MSLINKMLQDLDARGGGAGRQGAAAMRAVAPSSRRSQRAVLAAGAGAAVLVLAAGGWFGWKYLHGAPGAASQPVAASVGAPPTAGSVSPPQPNPAAGAGGATQLRSASSGAPQAGANSGAAQTIGGAAAAGQGQAATADTAAPAEQGSIAPGAAAALQGETKAEAHKRRLAEEKAAAALAAELNAARKKARDARAEADALVTAPGAGRAATVAKAAPASAADKPAARLAAKPAARAREPEAARPVANGVTVTSQQQADHAYRRALLALQDARVNEAISGLEQAVFIFPRHEAARQTLIGLLLENRRNDEAIRHLQLGLGLDPKQPQMAMLLARLQIEKGGPAIDTLLRTLPYAGSHAEYIGFLAGALQRAQRHKEAVEQYQAALRLMPQNGVWWMGLGISLQAEKRNAEAQDAYTRAKASGSLSPELTGFVERKLQQLGR